MIKLDLGGIGKGQDGWKTINLLPGVDIQEDIMDIDNYCHDNSVDIFKLNHTFEHLPSVSLEGYMKKLLKKLKEKGKLMIVQTDIKKTISLFAQNKLDFYCLRDIIFTPLDRRKKIFNIAGRDLQHHQFIWGANELKKELLYYGFSEVQVFDAGSWSFDCASIFPFQENEKYFGVKIPNLGLIGIK